MGSVSNEGFYASYNASDWGALPAGASVSLTPIAGGGFSLVYNPGS